MESSFNKNVSYQRAINELRIQIQELKKQQEKEINELKTIISTLNTKVFNLEKVKVKMESDIVDLELIINGNKEN